MKTDEEYFPLLSNRQYDHTSVYKPLDMKFKDAVTQGMTELGEEGAIFIGYSLLPGDAMGTAQECP